MASSSPDPNRSPPLWLRGLAWSLPGSTLLWTVAGVVLPDSALLLALRTAIVLVLQWGCVGVLMIALQRLPRPERLSWSPLAVVLVAQAFAQVLSGASAALGASGPGIAPFWLAVFAAVFSVVAVGRPGQDGASTWGQLMQGVADIAVLLMVAVLALAMCIPLLRWLNLSRHWIDQISVDREGQCDTKALTQVRAESWPWSPDHARCELSTAPRQGLT